MAYSAGNVLQLNDSFTFRCYICNQIINPVSSKSRDHVIPKVLFDDERTNRPTIDVHTDCNSNDKSKEDNWFAKSILYRCLLNPVAHRKFTAFLESADRSRTDHEFVTSGDRSNERLLRTVLEGSYTSGILDDKNRESSYIRMLAQGLIIRNSWHIKCSIAEVFSINKAFVNKKQKEKLYIYFQEKFLDQLDHCIFQFWNTDIRYVINPQENLLYLEFYDNQVYILGFDYELPHVILKKEHITDEHVQEIQYDIDEYNKIWHRPDA